MRQRRAPKEWFLDVNEDVDLAPRCPPTKLSLRLRKHAPEVKQEPPEVAQTPPATPSKAMPNLKLKVPPNYGIHFVGQNLSKLFSGEICRSFDIDLF